MKATSLLQYILVITQFVFTQNPESAETINFQCKVLHPETAEYPEVSVASDTVKFRLFYVDDGCSGFTYRFSQKENVLLLQRTTTPPDTCTTDEQVLYGVEGFIANLPKGYYLLELHTGTDEDTLESIFREGVTVR
jgi:hypothetical protein